MPCSLLALLAIPGAFSVFGLWLWHVNRGITIVPSAALALSPHRWTTEEILKAATEVDGTPLDTLPYLPPATGRRYIIIGGSGEQSHPLFHSIVALKVANI